MVKVVHPAHIRTPAERITELLVANNEKLEEIRALKRRLKELEGATK